MLSFAAAPVVELRQYTLKPGGFPALAEVFEDHFIEGQEATGMTIAGTYADSARPDRFVWMRGFADMESRRAALQDFYTGPVWKAHGAAANATMIDSDDVLLMRPTSPAHPLAPARDRAPIGTSAELAAWTVVTVLEHAPDPDLESWLTNDVHALLEELLGTAVATWRTEPAENTFPALPVRDVNAFVWAATFEDEAALDTAMARLAASPDWADGVEPRLAEHVTARQDLRLRPTPRSAY